MKKEVIVNADTLEEAKQIACDKLKAKSIEDLDFEVLQMPEKKKFGIFGGADAKVRAFLKRTPLDDIYDYLMIILKGFGSDCDFKVDYEVENNIIRFNISEEDLRFIIGHRGEVINSIQRLLNAFARNKFRNDNVRYKIFVNAGNYREKREDTLKSLANKMAQKAIKQNRNIHLEHMNAYERKIVHDEIQNIDGVKSWSEGEGLKRHVIIGLDKYFKSGFNKENC